MDFRMCLEEFQASSMLIESTVTMFFSPTNTRQRL